MRKAIGPDTKTLLLAAVLLACSAASRAEQRMCMCFLAETGPCSQACKEPPKQDVKFIDTPSGGGFITSLGSSGVGSGGSWEPLFPAVPSGNSPDLNRVLRDPQLRDQIKRELDRRAAVASAKWKALSETSKANGAPAVPGQQFKLDARRYEKWGAAIGAAEARSRLETGQ